MSTKWGIGLLVLLLICAAVTVAVTAWWTATHPQQNAEVPSRDSGDTAKPQSADGSVASSAVPKAAPVTQVERTVVVATLDEPLPDGKSAIWCASFQLAWDQVKEKIAKGPVELENGGELVSRLNQAEVADDELRSEDYLAVAGSSNDELKDSIRAKLKQRFPNATHPALDFPGDGLAAVAFLALEVPWRFEFHDNPNRFDFRSGDGTSTAVRSFGILESDDYKDGDRKFFRGQPAILWDAENANGFAVDLCRESRPYQVVLARMDRKQTLRETLDDLQRKIQTDPPKDDHLHEHDRLLVPNMFWRIDHHFKELEGKDLLNGPNAGLPLQTAVQSIQFRLDRKGASLESGAEIHFLNGGHGDLYFAGPFLLYVKKRGAKQPVLVMWVENAELLQQF